LGELERVDRGEGSFFELIENPDDLKSLQNSQDLRLVEREDQGIFVSMDLTVGAHLEVSSLAAVRVVIRANGDECKKLWVFLGGRQNWVLNVLVDLDL